MRVWRANDDAGGLVPPVVGLPAGRERCRPGPRPCCSTERSGRRCRAAAHRPSVVL